MTAIQRSVALFLAATWLISCGSPAENEVARPDEAHVASQHVEQLRQFIDTELAQELTNRGDAPAGQDHVGIYLLDQKAVQQKLEEASDTAETAIYVQQVLSMLKDLKGSIELKADGTAIIKMSMGTNQPEQKTVGAWAREGKHLTITNEGNTSDAKQLIYTGDTLMLNDESGPILTSWIYQREKSTK